MIDNHKLIQLELIKHIIRTICVMMLRPQAESYQIRSKIFEQLTAHDQSQLRAKPS
jgi:metal-dependent HD superfamily phosphatase/phosphodiesterase